MRKESILRRKVIRAYRNPENWEYSRRKGYGGYFGYQSLGECIRCTVKEFVGFYGKGLRCWRYVN